ncbi:MAG TPA: hypothetical protein VGP48_03220 [Stellaceae bacterium]|nr:hypothetical protein [Stellaceae bacterium]
MPAIVTEILRLPLFPIVILGLIAFLYWRGVMTMRQKKAAAKSENPADKR